MEEHLTIRTERVPDAELLKVDLKASFFESSISFQFEMDRDMLGGEIQFDKWLIEVTRFASDDPVMREFRDSSFGTRVGHGRRLFRKLFIDSPLDAQDRRKFLDKLPDTHIVIASPDPGLLSFPWELMYSDDVNSFPLLNANSVVRQLVPVPRPAAKSQTLDQHELIPRMLFVVMRPGGERDIEPHHLARDAFGNSSVALHNTRIDVLAGGSFNDLVSRLKAAYRSGSPYSVVHFDGHGDFLARPMGKPRGVLLFESGRARAEQVTGEQLGQACSSLGVKGVFLNACRSDSSKVVRGRDILTGESFACELVKQGLDTVIAMSHEVSKKLASQFFRAFYEQFFVGHLPGYAANRAKNSVLRTTMGGNIEGTAEVLDVLLVPRVYESRPLTWAKSPKIIYPGDPFAAPWVRDKTYEAYHALHVGPITLVTTVPGCGDEEIMQSLDDALLRAGIARENVVHLVHPTDKSLKALLKYDRGPRDWLYAICRVEDTIEEEVRALAEYRDKLREKNISLVVFCRRWPSYGQETGFTILDIAPVEDGNFEDYFWGFNPPDIRGLVVLGTWICSGGLVGLARETVADFLEAAQLGQLEKNSNEAGFLGLGEPGEEQPGDARHFIDWVNERVTTMGLHFIPRSPVLGQHVRQVESSCTSMAKSRSERDAFMYLAFSGYRFSMAKLRELGKLDAITSTGLAGWTTSEWQGFLAKCQVIGLLVETSKGFFARLPWSYGVLQRVLASELAEQSKTLFWSRLHEDSMVALVYSALDEVRWYPHSVEARADLEGELGNLHFLLHNTSPSEEASYFVAYYLGFCELLVHARSDPQSLASLLTVDPGGYEGEIPGQVLAMVHDIQGRLKERLGDLDGAEASYRAMVAADASRPAYARLGVLLMASRRLASEALVVLDKANEYEGRSEYTGVDAIVSYYRGNALEFQGDSAGAEQAYRELTRENPGGDGMRIGARASLDLAKIYARQSLAENGEIDPMRPLVFFQRAIDESGDFVPTKLEAYKHCVLYLLKKQLLAVEPEEMLCRMIGLARENAEPEYLRAGYSLYASIYASMGRKKEAKHFSDAAKVMGGGLGT